MRFGNKKKTKNFMNVCKMIDNYYSITQHYIIFEEYNVRQLFSYFFIFICGTAATMETTM